MAVEFSKRAAKEFDEIFKRMLAYSRDDREYAEQVANLGNDLQRLAFNPLLGTPIKRPDMEGKLKWLIGNQNQWIIYFVRPMPDTITIMMVRGAKKAPLTPEQIEKVFKRRL